MRELKLKAAEWNVSLDEIRETETSLLGFGARDGVRVVLKLTKQHCDESHSGAVLRAYDGDGAVRVFESETGAVLLERLEPGPSKTAKFSHKRHKRKPGSISFEFFVLLCG